MNFFPDWTASCFQIARSALGSAAVSTIPPWYPLAVKQNDIDHFANESAAKQCNTHLWLWSTVFRDVSRNCPYHVVIRLHRVVLDVSGNVTVLLIRWMTHNCGYVLVVCLRICVPYHVWIMLLHVLILRWPAYDWNGVNSCIFRSEQRMLSLRHTTVVNCGNRLAHGPSTFVSCGMTTHRWRRTNRRWFGRSHDSLSCQFSRASDRRRTFHCDRSEYLRWWSNHGSFAAWVRCRRSINDNDRCVWRRGSRCIWSWIFNQRRLIGGARLVDFALSFWAGRWNRAIDSPVHISRRIYDCLKLDNNISNINVAGHKHKILLFFADACFAISRLQRPRQEDTWRDDCVLRKLPPLSCPLHGHQSYELGGVPCQWSSFKQKCTTM